MKYLMKLSILLFGFCLFLPAYSLTQGLSGHSVDKTIGQLKKIPGGYERISADFSAKQLKEASNVHFDYGETSVKVSLYDASGSQLVSQQMRLPATSDVSHEICNFYTCVERGFKPKCCNEN